MKKIYKKSLLKICKFAIKRLDKKYLLFIFNLTFNY